MKIFDILLASSLLTFSPGKTHFNNIMPPALASCRRQQNVSSNLQFVELKYSLEDYVHFQDKFNDFTSFIDLFMKHENVDNMIRGKKPIDQIWAIMNHLSRDLEEEHSNHKLVEKTDYFLNGKILDAIFKNSQSSSRSFGSSGGSSGGSSSGGSSGGGNSGGGGGNPTPTKLNQNAWLADALGQAAATAWFNAKYGTMGSDDKGSSGENLWKASSSFTDASKTFVKTDPTRLKKLFDTWKNKPGSSYNARLNQFTSTGRNEAAKKNLWKANRNIPNYLVAYDTWRKSKAPGKGIDVLMPIWKRVDALNYQAAFNAWQRSNPGGTDAQYQASNTANIDLAKWTGNMDNGNGVDNVENRFLAHGDSDKAVENWIEFDKKTETEFDILSNTKWEEIGILWAKDTYDKASWSTNSGHFFDWFKTLKNGTNIDPAFINIYKTMEIYRARNNLDTDGTYSDIEISADIIQDFSNKAWWLIEYYVEVYLLNAISSDKTAMPKEFITWFDQPDELAGRKALLAQANPGGEVEAEFVHSITTESNQQDYTKLYKEWRDALDFKNLYTSDPQYDLDYQAYRNN